MENYEEIEKRTNLIAKASKEIFELHNRCQSIKITKEGNFIKVCLGINKTKK